MTTRRNGEEVNLTVSFFISKSGNKIATYFQETLPGRYLWLSELVILEYFPVKLKEP